MAIAKTSNGVEQSAPTASEGAKRKMGKEEQPRRLEMALGWSCFAEIEQEAVASVNRSET